MARLAIIGSGAWGSALSIALIANFNKIYLICKNKQQQNFKVKHSYLGIVIDNNNIIISTNYNILTKVDAILIATPSYAFANIITNIMPYLDKQQIAWATKGFSDGQLLHQIFSNKLPKYPCCIISGPSFAAEVARFKPTALVVASNSTAVSDFWTKAISTKYLRSYKSSDVIGVEVGGAIKNILAIAAGISVGLGFGANTMSALITRGLTEMIRFGVVLGAKKETFIGLSGLGDLTLTCLDDLSRNRQFGQQLVKNNSVELALQTVGATVEGINAIDTVLSIAKKHNINMPICKKIKAVIIGDISAIDAVYELMNRDIIYE